jgi:hypothetical protein
VGRSWKGFWPPPTRLGAQPAEPAPGIGQQCLDSSVRNRARHLYFCWRKAKLLLLVCTIRFVFAAPEASTVPSQREEFAGTGDHLREGEAVPGWVGGAQSLSDRRIGPPGAAVDEYVPRTLAMILLFTHMRDLWLNSRL